MPVKKRGPSRVLTLPKGVRLNARNKIDGLKLLSLVKPGAASLVFFDPQYRGILDRQKYGNKERQKGRLKLPQMTNAVIASFVTAIVRALKPSGHLVLWTDKFAVASCNHMLWWDHHIGDIECVDMIAWNKIVPGMGRRARCYTEYALIFQKEPTRAKGVWLDRGIMDSWPESADRSQHAHAKPSALTYRLIRAVTRSGDLVVDPCAGSYMVLGACQANGRQFLGGDLI